MSYRVGIVGTGPNPGEKSREGYAMAYRHAPGYRRLEECELVACADHDRGDAAAFAAEHGVDLAEVYEDYLAMLREADLDIVSVCVPPAVHAEVVIDCAEQGDLAAIHCEKPMATTWGDCRAMVETCDRNDVQLTVDHQQRFARPIRRARRLLESGEIGELRRLEWSAKNLFDAGSHLFDLCDLFTGGARPAWALAGVDPDPDNRWFGALNAVRAIAQWEYENGIQGTASTAEGDREAAVDAYLRLVGTDGVVEIPRHEPSLRVRTDGGWRTVDTGDETVHGRNPGKVAAAASRLAAAVPGARNAIEQPTTHYDRAIEHLVQSLREGATPAIAGSNALRGTELIFACWESARRRERVDLPLEIDGNPLESIVESGIDPESGPGARSKSRSGSGSGSDPG